MATVEEVVDKFTGMITPGQAQELIDSGSYARHTQNKDITSVQALLEFISTNRGRQPAQLYTVNIKDTVYRVFNPVSRKRIAVLGKEGETAKLSLSGRLSDEMDTACVERGDTIIVKSAVLDAVAGELRTDKDTSISKVSSNGFINCITDYSALRDGMRNIDVLGKLAEIGEIRHVNRLGNGGQVPVVDCVISDNRNTARLSLWESSALLVAGLNVNDIVKVEFCSVRINDGKVEIYANSLSRLLSGNALASRLR
ncbi:MAG: hypothetical protein ACREBW_02155 [Candidatus Micrarchaeaceae archaeon]